jgi:hypothetical protein
MVNHLTDNRFRNFAAASSINSITNNRYAKKCVSPIPFYCLMETHFRAVYQGAYPELGQPNVK